MEHAYFDKINVGETHSLSRKITNEHVQLFADVTGDYNPLHFNEEFSEKSIFGGKIVHGMLIASLMVTLIRKFYPGISAVFLEAVFDFVRPVRIGDNIKFNYEITQKKQNKKIIKINCECINDSDELVFKGFTLTKLLE